MKGKQKKAKDMPGMKIKMTPQMLGSIKNSPKGKVPVSSAKYARKKGK